MICPTCGAEVASTKFCENCGSSLPAALEPETQPIAEPTAPIEPELQPVVEPTTPIEQPTASVDAGAPVPPASAAAAPQPSFQQPAPDQQSVPYQAPPAAGVAGAAGAPPAPGVTSAANMGNRAPNAAFVLVIVGLVLSVMFFTFVPGLICSIIGLVLNAGYNKKGLDNPRKTSTMVIGIIGIVMAALCAAFAIFIGVVTAQVVDEVERQGIDLANNSIEVSTDSSGNVNVTVGGSSSSADASSTASSSASTSSSTSASSSTASGAYEDAKYHDSEWNPTLYSLVELTGAQLSDMLESYNFYWDTDYTGWSAADGSLFAANDIKGNLSKSQIAALPKGAAGQAVVMGLWVEGYSASSDAVKALSSDVTVEQQRVLDGRTYAIISSPSKVRYLVFATESSAGTNEQAILLFTEESISNGLFTDLTGVDAGSSIDEVWSAIRTS